MFATPTSITKTREACGGRGSGWQLGEVSALPLVFLLSQNARRAGEMVKWRNGEMASSAAEGERKTRAMKLTP